MCSAQEEGEKKKHAHTKQIITPVVLCEKNDTSDLIDRLINRSLIAGLHCIVYNEAIVECCAGDLRKHTGKHGYFLQH